MRTNAKGKLYVGVLVAIAGLVAGTAAFFAAASITPAPKTPNVSTVATGQWISTCSGGLMKSACTQGVLQVTFKDGSKTHVPMRASATYGPTLDVVSKGSGWVVYTGEQSSPGRMMLALAILAAGLAAALGAVVASFIAVETVPRWGIATLYA